ncbi:MAG TPA: hypothetical protein VM662_13855, partial [Sphingomonas sp.]|nr:hypothetical protein [Sphingomonas sp.]
MKRNGAILSDAGKPLEVYALFAATGVRDLAIFGTVCRSCAIDTSFALILMRRRSSPKRAESGVRGAAS